MDIRSFFNAKSKSEKSITEANNNAAKKPLLSTVVKETPTKTAAKPKRSSKRTPSKTPPGKKKTTTNEERNSKKGKKAAASYDDDKVDIVVSDDDDDFTTIKTKQKSSGSSKVKGDAKKNRSKKAKERSESESPTVKKKKFLKEEEDDDEDSPLKTKKRSKRKQTRHQVVSSDEEEEQTVSKKESFEKPKKGPIIYDSDNEHQVSIEDAFKKVRQKPDGESHKTTTSSGSKKKSPDKKQISAVDFFGMGAVKRSEKQGTPTKRKLKEESEELEIHDDDDFEKTLADLDDRQPAKKAKMEATPPAKQTASSLASKLAAAKAEISSGGGGITSTKTEKPASKASPSPKKGSPPLKSSKITSPGKGAAKLTPEKQKVSNKSPGEKTVASTPVELQRKGSTGFRAYLHREGPQALGSKEIPQGADNCLEGLTFVITGVLESMERDVTKSLIEKYGGKVTGSISKKTSYVVTGRDAGESKMAKAHQMGTKELDEDALLDLVRTLPGKKSKYEVEYEKQQVKEKKMSETKTSGSVTTPGKPASQKLQSFTHTPDRKPQMTSTTTTPRSAHMSQESQSSQRTASPQKSAESEEVTLMWVDKYKPSQLRQIIGQQGDKSNARKLLHWLQSWHKNRGLGKKPAFNRFNDDGSGHKAALLSGPPGVGKTTTAQLVCQEADFSFVELNASDTRSKKSLQTEVAEALGNHTLVDYFGSKSGDHQADGKTHCLVMDEVDGMAGNQDRGGMQELIGLIKTTKIPIICMCNDRNSQKVRSLANYCFDLRFQRPRVEQIKSAMMSIAFKEGFRIPPPALNEIISAANQDVRQVLHNLNMWTSTEKNLSFEQAKEDSSKAKKDLKLGPFDVCRKVFVGGEETAHMTLNDKSDLFFHDYSFGPLFVQENYIHVTPYSAKGRVSKHLDQLSQAADSLAEGDMVDKHVRGGGMWNLLPLQAMFASVIPGEAMRGSMQGMIQFPSWLGKNSTTNKTDRLLQELKTHMRIKLFSDKKGLNMDYLPHLRRSLTDPLIQRGSEGVKEVVDLLNDYDLQREDFDNIMELSSWTGSKDPMSRIESKTKAAFTRAYNKEVHQIPYSLSTTVKKSKRKGGASDGGVELEGLEGEEIDGRVSSEEEDNLLADGMIKQSKKKKPAAKKPAANKTSDTKKTAGPSKGKGGKGKKK